MIREFWIPNSDEFVMILILSDQCDDVIQTLQVFMLWERNTSENQVPDEDKYQSGCQGTLGSASMKEPHGKLSGPS